MNAAEVIALIAGSSLLSSIAVALLARRNDTFSKFTEAYGKLAGRVTDLEVRLETVEGQLNTERQQHSRARELLRVSLRHIRDVIAWGIGDRQRPLPTPPVELFQHLEHPDG